MSDKKESVLSVKRTGSGRSSVLELNPTQESLLGEGGIGKVTRFEVERSSGVAGPNGERKPKAPLTFAYKKLKNSDMPELPLDDESVKAYQDNIQRIHKKLLSLPNGHKYVPGTMRLTSEGVVMSDLSQNGKYLVFSWNDVEDNNIQHVLAKLGENSNLKQIVEQIDITSEEWLSEFNVQQELIASETSNAHLYVPSDAPMIVFKPENKFSIMLGDLDYVADNNLVSVERLKQNNLGAIKELISPIESLLYKLASKGFRK